MKNDEIIKDLEDIQNKLANADVESAEVEGAYDEIGKLVDYLDEKDGAKDYLLKVAIPLVVVVVVFSIILLVLNGNLHFINGNEVILQNSNDEILFNMWWL